MLPLTSALQGDDTHNWLFGQAGDVLTAECMKKQGFTYPVVARSKEGSTTDTTPMPFGRINLDRSKLEQAQPAEGPQIDLTPEGERALNGSGKTVAVPREDGTETNIPVDGCGAEADLALMGSLDDMKTFITLNARLRKRWSAATESATADSQVKTLVEKWSACMKGKGYSMATPNEIVELLADRSHATGSFVDPHDVPEAVADIECKKEQNFLPTAYGILAREEQKQIDADPGTLLELNQRRAAMDQRARAALARNGMPTA